jgi:hypothetical protein
VKRRRCPSTNRRRVFRTGPLACARCYGDAGEAWTNTVIKRPVRLLLVAGALIGMSGCSTTASQSVNRGQDDGGGADAACTTAGYAIDLSHSCRSDQATVLPFCETAGLGMGEYVLCGVSPSGEMVLFGASSTTTLTGDQGWTFGPSSWVPSIFHLPTLSGSNESLCNSIAITISPQAVAVCGVSSDAGSLDGSLSDDSGK